jgi:hypothetical protein
VNRAAIVTNLLRQLLLCIADMLPVKSLLHFCFSNFS